MTNPASGSQPEFSQPTQSGDELLQRVIRATLSRPASAGAAEQDSYLAVARRYANHDWCLEPVAYEIVTASLAEWFAATRLSAAARDSLSHQIADALFHDPVANDRLKTWWNDLRRNR